MKRREDWELIKTLSKHYKGTEQLALRPLVVLEDKTTINNDLRKIFNADIGLDKVFTKVNPSNWINSFDFLTDCLFLDKAIKVKNPKQSNTLAYNYVRFIRKYHDGKDLLIMQLFALDGWRYTAMYDVDVGVESIYVCEDNATNVNSLDLQLSKGLENHTDEFRFMVVFMIKVFTFFFVLSQSDLYPVERKNTSVKKIKPHVAKQKPWIREDLVSIVFLNQLPREQSEAKGGHHASPRYHHRRGTWVNLRNERYKNHPKYGDKIYRKASWVGEREAIVNGTTYKVL